MFVPNNRPVVDFNIGFESQWQITLTDAKTGKVKMQLPWHKNTILDAGLNLRLTSSLAFLLNSIPYLFTYIAIGTGNTAPATTDTTLETEVSRKIYNSSLTTYSFATAAEPYFIVGSQWGTSEGNGDLKEVGLCSASVGGTFWNRNLFRDEGGSPITVTKTTSDILTVLCKTIIKRASDTPYEVTLDGRTVKGLVLNAGLQNAVRTTFSQSHWWITNHTLKAGTSNSDPAAAQTTILGTSLGTSESVVWSSAVTGPPDFYREGVFTFLSYQGNGNIGEVTDISKPMQARHTFDSVIAKTDSQQLSLTVRYSLSRV